MSTFLESMKNLFEKPVARIALFIIMDAVVLSSVASYAKLRNHTDDQEIASSVSYDEKDGDEVLAENTDDTAADEGLAEVPAEGGPDQMATNSGANDESENETEKGNENETTEETTEEGPKENIKDKLGFLAKLNPFNKENKGEDIATEANGEGSPTEADATAEAIDETTDVTADEAVDISTETTNNQNQFDITAIFVPATYVDNGSHVFTFRDDHTFRGYFNEANTDVEGTYLIDKISADKSYLEFSITTSGGTITYTALPPQISAASLTIIDPMGNVRNLGRVDADL